MGLSTTSRSRTRAPGTGGPTSRNARAGSLRILLPLALLRNPQMVREVAEHLEPSRLCAYLHRLAPTFNGFYQHSPERRCEDAEVRASRLRLCAISKHVLQDGLGLLGITAPERM
ncbi:MAG: DALR anticodon-binding domain-containing protein [Phycisphaerales bacterium]